jgi:hypothetical protein
MMEFRNQILETLSMARAADWRHGGRADGLGLFDVAGGGNFLASLAARQCFAGRGDLIVRAYGFVGAYVTSRIS